MAERQATPHWRYALLCLLMAGNANADYGIGLATGIAVGSASCGRELKEGEAACSRRSVPVSICEKSEDGKYKCREERQYVGDWKCDRKDGSTFTIKEAK